MDKNLKSPSSALDKYLESGNELSGLMKEIQERVELREPDYPYYSKMDTPICPEQHTIYDKNTQEAVGYVRVRHGTMRVDALLPERTTVCIVWLGEGAGMFAGYEREYYLDLACRVVQNYYWDIDLDDFRGSDNEN